MTDSFVDFDPIENAENRFGKRWQDFDDKENLAALGISIAYNIMKKKMYETKEDNWFGAPLEVTANILTEFGFKSVLILDGCGERIEDRKYVMHLDSKILAIFDTYGGHLNSGDVYALALMEKPDFMGVPDRFSGGWSEKDQGMHISYDIREGLRTLLEKLTALNLKSFPWIYKSYINLLAPGEESFSGTWQDNPNHLDDYSKLSDRAVKLRMPLIAERMGLKNLFVEE